MGIKGKDLLRGLGAGLQTFGVGYGKALEHEDRVNQQNLENTMAQERLDQSKLMNESLLKERSMKMDQMKFENDMKKAAASHTKMTSAISAGGYNPEFSSGIINKHHPSGIAYRFEPGMSDDNNYTFTRGHYKRDPETGNPILKDGEKVFQPLPGLAAQWKGSPKQWAENVNKLMDPVHVQAMTRKEDVLNMQLNFMEKEHNWRKDNDEEYKKRWLTYLETTPGGQRKAESERLGIKQQKKNLEAPPKGTKPAAASFTWKDSKKNLTSQEVEIAKADRRALEEKGYEGIRVQDAWRIGQAMDSPKEMRILDGAMKKYLAGDASRTDVLKMHKRMDVPRKFIEMALDDADENPDMFSDGGDGPGMQQSSGGISGWWQNLKNSMSGGVDDGSMGGMN